MPQGRRTKVLIFLSPEERRIFESWQRSTTISQGLARRGRIILMLSEGASISEIARTVGIARGPIYMWAERFQHDRIDGLKDKPGRGRPRRSLSGCMPTGGAVLKESHSMVDQSPGGNAWTAMRSHHL